MTARRIYVITRTARRDPSHHHQAIDFVRVVARRNEDRLRVVPDGNFEIYVMNADGTGLRGSRSARGPTHSGVVAHRRSDRFLQHPQRQPGDLRDETPTSSGPTRVTNHSPNVTPAVGARFDQPVFSSDRTGTATSTRCGERHRAHPVTTSSGADVIPEWSPDGSKIAFTSSRDGNTEIYVMNPNGSIQTS